MSEPPNPVQIARRLLRLARTAAMASLAPETGAPLTTLVGVATDEDGTPLLLLSSLAAHSKNIANDARASLLIGAPAVRGDPLNVARVTLNGRVEPADTPRGRERYLQRNPKSKLMMGLRDFQIFRLDISGVHYNGGRSSGGADDAGRLAAERGFFGAGCGGAKPPRRRARGPRAVDACARPSA